MEVLNINGYTIKQHNLKILATGRTILAKRNVRTNQFYTISTYTVVSQLDAVGLFCSNKLSLVIYNTEFRRVKNRA